MGIFFFFVSKVAGQNKDEAWGILKKAFSPIREA